MYYFVFDGRGILMDISESYAHAREMLDLLADAANPPKLEVYSREDFLPAMSD